jgi:tetratricopeptide (TPR) repeat protein
MYLPMIAFAAAAGRMLESFDFRILSVAGILLALVSSVTTAVWRTPESLWRNAHRRAPQKTRPLLQLARSVDPPHALELLKDASDPALLGERGRVYLALNQPENALQDFGRALAISPGDPRALNNRGAALLALGQPDAARLDFRRALEKQPCFFEALWNLSRAGSPASIPDGCRLTEEQRALLATGK